MFTRLKLFPLAASVAVITVVAAVAVPGVSFAQQPNFRINPNIRVVPPAPNNQPLFSLPGSVTLSPSELTINDPNRWTLEAENMVDRVDATRGPVSAQPMGGFGPGWSNNAQLFWQPPTPQASKMTIPISVSQGGRYNILLHYTLAPDYGTIRARVRYRVTARTRFQPARIIESPPRTLDGYGPRVTPPKQVAFSIPLTDGAMELELTLVGRDNQSTGFFVGIDKIDFHKLN
jgi:hypothetical protein